MSDYTMRVVQLDAKAMDSLLRSPSGTLGRHIGGMGIKIMFLAKRMAGSNTGRLSKSIKMDHVRAAGGQLVRVYSNVKYAYMVHEGTKPHIIDPPGARVMAFNIGGKRVYTQQVHHPGTRGKYYLTIPMKRVVR